MQRRQSGFTIIELVVVIILLGILAATALPRFMDVDEQAHEAVVDGVLGSLQTGISLFHAEYIALEKPDPDTQLASFNFLRNNIQGYPYGTDDNSAGSSDVTDSDDCEAVFTGVLQGGAPSIANAAGAAGVVGAPEDFVAVFSAGPLCTYYYTAESSASGATVSTIEYDPAEGQLTLGSAVLP